MKYLFFHFIILFSFTGLGQTGYGTIKITAFENATNNLDDNKPVDSLHVRIQNSKNTVDTVYVISAGKKNNHSLPHGYYKLTISIENHESILLERVTVSADKITFIDLLFEPTKAMKKSEIRAREKLFYNYWLLKKLK